MGSRKKIIKNCLSITALAGALVLAGAPPAVAEQQPPAMGHAAELAVKALPPTTQDRLTVTSPSFKEGADIPFEYTQYRGNVFPGLAWTDGPSGTRSYAVIVQGESLSRVGGATSIHLTIFNLPENVTALKSGMTTPPAGATYGPNVHGLNQPYAGPHTHTPAKNGYHYQVFALDTMLQLKPNVDFDALVVAMTGHVLASGDLLGLSAKDPNATEPAAPGRNSIRIETGLLPGVPGRDPSITAYKGVPYTAPPVGAFASGPRSRRSPGRACVKPTTSAKPVRRAGHRKT